jgi:hypothetical protein
LLSKFGPKAIPQGTKALAQQIEALTLRHGDDAITAIRRIGPHAIQLAHQAGEHAGPALRLMARYGDEAVWVVQNKNRLAIFVKYGDNAAISMMKHGEIAEPLLHNYGQAAANALSQVNGKNARYLCIMHNNGELAQLGRTSELLEVIGKYGDRAADFVWKHKGALAVGAALTAFLANPEPFLDGLLDITKITSEAVGTHLVEPLASSTGQAMVEAAKQINWTVVILAGMGIGGALYVWRRWQRRSTKRRSAASPAAITPQP